MNDVHDKAISVSWRAISSTSVRPIVRGKRNLRVTDCDLVTENESAKVRE